MYNELSVKEMKKKRFLLELANDGIFLYSHVFFFLRWTEIIQKTVTFELTHMHQKQCLDYY